MWIQWSTEKLKQWRGEIEREKTNYAIFGKIQKDSKTF